LELPGAITEGDSLDELKANMNEAIDLVQDQHHKVKFRFVKLLSY